MPLQTESEAKRMELEEYAQAYFKYTKLFQDEADAMRHNPDEMNAAHARITAECLAVKKNTPVNLMTAEDAQKIMAEYARWCEDHANDEPQTFDELSIRILFLGSTYRDGILAVSASLLRPRFMCNLCLMLFSKLQKGPGQTL
jgi:hypothetical protein